MVSFRQFMFPPSRTKPLSPLQQEIRRRGKWLSFRPLEPTAPKPVDEVK